MNKLISYIYSLIIAYLVMCFIGAVLAAIILVVGFIINRGIVYYKSHKRFTDWEFQYEKVEMIFRNGNTIYQRIEYFERFDREMVLTEEMQNIIPIKVDERMGVDRSLMLDRLHYNLNVSSKRLKAQVEAQNQSEGRPTFW